MIARKNTDWGRPWSRKGPRKCGHCGATFPSYDRLYEHRCRDKGVEHFVSAAAFAARFGRTLTPGEESKLVWPQMWQRRCR